MKRALILGIGGQDGSYLADILLEKGYEVHGLYRRSSVDNLVRIRHIRDRVELHKGDLTDPISLSETIGYVNPDEVYNEADQDDVGWSYETPGVSMDVTAKGVVTVLETIRLHKLFRSCNTGIRFFQPISATVFGDAPAPQTEETLFNPQSPYACAKTLAYYVARYYRETYGLFVCTAFLYNHDSVRRGSGYLLHDICCKVRKAAAGRLDEIRVGDPEMRVDIGCAREYMESAWSMMQLENPDDYVISSGRSFAIRSIIQEARAIAECEPVPIVADPELLRPGKQPVLLTGDSSKAKGAFGFAPTRNVFDVLGDLLQEVYR